MQPDRKKFIGGSDIAAVLGLSRWKTPLQLWSEKAGKVEPDDISTKEYVQLGSELEEFIAKKFEKETGMKVRRAPGMYLDKQYPFMACQVDRLLTGTDEILECKNVSAWKAKEWEGEDIPLEYIFQVQWQLMVTGKKIGWIAVLIGGNRFIYKKIEADQEIFDQMKASAISFWDMVQNGIPPSVTGEDNNFIVNLYPNAGEEIKEASESVEEAIAFLQQTKAEIIELEKVKKNLEATIKESIGDLLGLKTPTYTAKWIDVKGSTFTVTKKDSRQLRITKNKED